MTSAAATGSAVPGAADRRRLLWGLLATAALLRVAYYVQYRELPFLEAPMFDSIAYLRQAHAVRAGNFGDASFVAFSPLYGYLIAIFGDLTIPVQLVMGLVNLWLLFRIVEDEWNTLAAAFATLLAMGYGMIVFYEGKLLSETLGLSLLFVAFRTYLSPRFRVAAWPVTLGAGVAMGFAVLARTNALFAGVFMAALAILPWEARGVPLAPWLSRVKRVAGFGIGLGIVLTANGVWNQAHMGRFVPLRAMKVVDAEPWDGGIERFSRDGKSTLVDALDYVRRAEETLASPSEGFMGMGVSDFQILRLLEAAPSKLATMFSDVETTFLYGYYGERTEVPVLRMLPVSMGSLYLLSLFGIGFAWRERGPRVVLPWLTLILGVMASSVVYYPASSYRVQLFPAVLGLSGFAIAALAAIAKERLGKVLISVAALACLWFTYQTWTYELSSPGMWELRVAEGEARRGNAPAAHARVQRALERGPRSRLLFERGGVVFALLGIEVHPAPSAAASREQAPSESPPSD